MKICFISAHGYPLFHPEVRETFGGAEVQLYLLGKELACDKNNTISFVTACPVQKASEVVGSITIYKSFSLNPQHMKNPLVIWLRRLINTITFFGVLGRINADIYIQRNAGAETGLIALYCALFHKKFVYMTAHDIDCTGEYIQRNRIKGLFFKYGVSRASQLITQTHYHQKLLLHTYRLESVVLRTAYEIGAKPIVPKEFILWVGRINEWKRPNLLLCLAERCPQRRFIIIGPRNCDTEQYEQFVAQAQKLKNVEYVPYVPFRDIDTYFTRACLLVNTSHYEGFPNTFVQAFKNGVPVASCNVNPDNMLREYSLGVCDADFDELCNKIERLLTDERLYARYANNCYEYAKTFHDIQVIREQFACFLREL